MFRQRSEETELMDDLTLANDALRKNLDELEIINHWLGGNKVVTQALSEIVPLLQKNPEPVSIADVGSGGGDILRVCANWIRNQNIQATLTGVDANAFMIAYAQEKCRSYPEIMFQQQDIFSEDFARQQFDVMICSLFCHHFSNAGLISLFEQLNRQATTAIIINDLHRHPLAYYSIKWLTKFFSGSYLVKNDAPLSVLRAFKKTELQKILKAAGITNYKLRWKWAFRWQLIILK